MVAFFGYIFTNIIFFFFLFADMMIASKTGFEYEFLNEYANTIQNDSIVNETNHNYYTCDQCDREYRSFRSLKRHKTYACGQIPRHICSFCMYITRYRSDLTRHIMLKHKMVAINNCT